MKETQVYSDFTIIDPYGNPLVVLKIDGRVALFAGQIASTFEGSILGKHLIQRLRDSNVYVEGEGWATLKYEEIKEIQRQEKITSGKSAVEAILSPFNSNGAAIIFEESLKRGVKIEKGTLDAHLSRENKNPKTPIKKIGYGKYRYFEGIKIEETINQMIEERIQESPVEDLPF